MSKLSIEKLLDMLVILKNDAESLYRYGKPLNAVEIFSKISSDDQKRFACLALIQGDKDTINVVNYLMNKPSLQNLLTEIPVKDKEEILNITKTADAQPLTSLDQERIARVLFTARSKMSSLSVEEAYWILIPEEAKKSEVWIKAMGVENSKDNVLLPFQVRWEPGQDEKYDLITSMRGARWILHIHNHPEMQGNVTTPASSNADRVFAKHWQTYRPTLANKMMYFVITKDVITHYSGRIECDLNLGQDEINTI